MVEKLLHFMWEHRAFNYSGLVSTSNEAVEIIDPGIGNPNAGPDFFNAKVKIAGTLWVGNVEMHVKSSDWFDHGHSTDAQYDNVILHVVVHNNQPATNTRGQQIPTLVVDYPSELEESLNTLLSAKSWLPCGGTIGELDEFMKSSMLQRLMVERLEQKTSDVLCEVEACGGSWEEAFYRSVVRCFGLKVNATPAELLAASLPLKCLAKHKNSLFQLEALLFGQSGLLHVQTSPDEYFRNLQSEYKFLQQKFSLTPINGHLWKFMRMRPVSFPTVRIAQLASLIHRSSSLFSRTMEVGGFKELEHLLTAEPSDYWLTHYTFQKETRRVQKTIGQQLISTITLNSVVPFMFAYGCSLAADSIKDRAFHIVEQMPPEDNRIVRGFAALGLKILTAVDSQAVIHLKTNRCDTKKCIYCEVGASILTKRRLS